MYNTKGNFVVILISACSKRFLMWTFTECCAIAQTTESEGFWVWRLRPLILYLTYNSLGNWWIVAYMWYINMNVNKIPVYIKNKNFKNKRNLCMSWGDGLAGKSTCPAPGALSETTDSPTSCPLTSTLAYTHTHVYTPHKLEWNFFFQKKWWGLVTCFLTRKQ